MKITNSENISWVANGFLHQCVAGKSTFFYGHTIQVQHAYDTTRPLPGVTLKQFREEWRLPIRATPRSVSRRLHQGRGEGDGARDGQHSRPSSLHEGHRELHVRRCVSRSGVCQHL